MKKIGILMLDTKFPRIKGDIGNEDTFSFPTVKKIVTGADTTKVVDLGDRGLLNNFIAAAKELESSGVSAITTSCGFLAKFQKELAESVDVPVFTSSLIQAKYIEPLLKKDQAIGILTIKKSSLTEEHFKGVGIENINKVIYSMEETSFEKTFMDTGIKFDKDKLQQDILDIATKMVNENPNVGAIICECTNMPPFSKAISDKLNIPVFDIVTLTNYIYSSLEKASF